MSAAAKSPNTSSFRVERGSLWYDAWKVAAVIGGVGLAATAAGAFLDVDRFAYAYLFAFFAVLTLVLGATFFVVLQFLTVAGWSVVVRRLAELVMSGAPVLLLLFLPLLTQVSRLYEWTHATGNGEHGESADHASAADEEKGAHKGNSFHPQNHAPALGQRAHGNYDRFGHAAPPDESEDGHEGHSPAEVDAHHRLIAHKAPYLNKPFFIARAFLYFAVWIGLAWFYFRRSTAQDESGATEYTVQMQKWAPLAMSLFGLTLTFAAFDWLMSLEPSWYSTIFGVYIFAGSAVAIHAFLSLSAMALRRGNGPLAKAVSVEHFHDLGKLLFGFNCFWAYIGVSQYLLIWYAGIPEEATYYHRRWVDGGWKALSILLVVGHFILPFFFLMSRIVKRRLPLYAFGVSWLLLMHILDIYWFVMPYANDGHFTLHWLDLAAFFGVAGTFFAFVLFQARRFPLVAQGDPRLPRSLSFVNA